MQPPAHRALYAAFDRYPSPKGAATHIRHMAATLFARSGGGLLFVLGDEDLPPWQRERGALGEVEIVRHAAQGATVLERALGFRRHLHALLGELGGLELCHFRDPWAGVAIVEHAARLPAGARPALVYEINGLPSIELPHAYPCLPQRTLDKIRAEERRCWSAAAAIVTPGRALRDNLVALGVPAGRITVIENGADLPAAVPPRPGEAPPRYLLYFGALQAWQGVDVLLRALSRLADLPDLGLVICAAARERQARPLRRLAARLGIADRVLWRFRLSQAELRPWLCHATLSIAPLTDCPRNVQQGCCPLKVLESMAAGVPVVAADLPAVRDLIEDGVHGRLVRPDRPQELARAVRVLLEYPELRARLGAQAQARVRERFTWQRARERLAALYERYPHE